MLRRCVLTVFSETDSSAAIQQEHDVWPGVCLQSAFGAPQPPLALVELAGPDHRAGEHYQRGCDHRFRAPAVPLAEGDRLTAALLGRGERVQDQRCECELRQPEPQPAPEAIPVALCSCSPVIHRVGTTVDGGHGSQLVKS
jgi:hypothetical protein